MDDGVTPGGCMVVNGEIVAVEDAGAAVAWCRATAHEIAGTDGVVRVNDLIRVAMSNSAGTPGGTMERFGTALRAVVETVRAWQAGDGGEVVPRAWVDAIEPDAPEIELQKVGRIRDVTTEFWRFVAERRARDTMRTVRPVVRSCVVRAARSDLGQGRSSQGGRRVKTATRGGDSGDGSSGDASGPGDGPGQGSPQVEPPTGGAPDDALTGPQWVGHLRVSRALGLAPRANFARMQAAWLRWRAGGAS